MVVAVNPPREISPAAKPPSKLKVLVPQDGTKLRYVFEPNEYIVGSIATLTIELEPSADTAHDKSSTIEMFSYCTTETDIGRVCVTSTKKGTTNTVVKPTLTAQAEPFVAGTEAIEFHIELQKRQFMFLGIIVKVTRTLGGQRKEEFYLCDPQVGNGPPAAGGLYSAVLLSA